MSRYNSIQLAIGLIEAMNRLMEDSGKENPQVAEVKADLQSIAKDVRYGGTWNGDYEVIAAALENCAETGHVCQACPYKKEAFGCTAKLKRDAAAAVRQLGKNLNEVRATLAEERKSKPAAWQQQIMKEDETAPEPPDTFPWDEDEPTVAPAAEVMGGEAW